MSSKLAINGGPKVRKDLFPHHPITGAEEKDAVMDILKEGRFSTFIAAPGEHFLGGQRIRAFEQEFAAYHGVRYAVAFNSATAALHAAVAAVGVEPGEEIITTPYTFTASASCALMHNAVPVFADVEPEYFCLDPKSVEQKISPLTKALIPVHIFGLPAAMDELLALARKHKLKVIEDCAQAPGAAYKKRKVGILGDCGIYSFQENKTIMTGEGGMLITNDESIADLARMVRNHGEAIAETMTHRTYASQLLGWNYRMTEFEAALGRVQLRHLDEWNTRRQELCGYISERIRRIPGFTPPAVRPDCTHVYYLYPFLYDETQAGLSRNVFADALRAEGIPVGTGYVKPLYLSPLYQERKAFAFKHYSGKASYQAGICPVAERLHSKTLVTFAVCRPPAQEKDMADIVTAIEKVLTHKDELSGR